MSQHPSSGTISPVMATRRPSRRRLTILEILAWAARDHAGTGRWPTNNSGAIVGAIGESWHAVDGAAQRSSLYEKLTLSCHTPALG